MVGDASTQQSDSVDRAMNQVLNAEREARDAVALCRAEAAQILAAAEEGARRTARRTECRIKLARSIADAAVERALRDLRSSGLGSEPTAPKTDLPELLDRVVDALVDEILSGRS